MFKFIEKQIIKFINIEKYLSLQIDITNFCNLNCSHCYHPHHENDGAISFNDWIAIINQYEEILNQLGAKGHIIICGGEPFASPILNPLLENIVNRNRKYHVSILTNGTLFQKLDLKLTKQIYHLDLQVSLDGPDAETHDLFRGKGNFKRTMEGVHFFKDNKINVNLLATLTKRNSLCIEKFFMLAKEKSIESMNFARLIVVNGAADLVSSGLDRELLPLELKKAYEEILFHSSRYEIRSSTNVPLMNLLHSALGKRQHFEEGIVVDYRGNMLLSSRSRVLLGSVLQEGLSELFYHHPLRLKMKTEKIEICSNCSHFEFCGGDRNVSFAHYQDFFKKDPGCWI